MHSPCFDCWNRYGHQYTKDCDKKCEYADAIKDIKWLISNWFSTLEDEANPILITGLVSNSPFSSETELDT